MIVWLDDTASCTMCKCSLEEEDYFVVCKKPEEASREHGAREAFCWNCFYVRERKKRTRKGSAPPKIGKSRSVMVRRRKSE